MVKKIIGTILIILGVILNIEGISYNNELGTQLHNGVSDFINDTAGSSILQSDNKGTSYIIFGIILIIVGIVLLVIAKKEDENSYSSNNNVHENSYKENDNKENYNKENHTDYDGRTNDVNHKKRDYNALVENINKVYNLYKNGIYSEEEYSKRKDEWIESLKGLESVNEENFLNGILPLIKEYAITYEELDTIKYIISGKYTEDRQEKERKKNEERKRRALQEKEESEKRIRELEREEARKREELKRQKKEKIYNDIGKIKTFFKKVYDRIYDFIENDLDKTKRRSLFAIVGVVVFVIVFAIAGSIITSPKRAVMAFENSVNDNDSEKLGKILYTSDKRLKFTSNSVEPIFKTFKTTPSEFTDLIENLNNQVSTLKDGGSENKTCNLYISKVGRTLLIFPKYKIAVNPVFMTITSSVKGADILLDGKKIAKADSENFSKQIGPYIPGTYDVEGKSNGNFGEMDNKIKVDFIKLKQQNKTVNALKGLYLQVSSDYNNNKIYINGKDTGKTVNTGDKIGPIASGASIYGIINYNGHQVKSSVYTLLDNDNAIVFDYSSEGRDPEQEKKDINDMITQYASTLADALTDGNTSELINYMYPGSKFYTEQMNNINSYYKNNSNFYEKYDSAVINSYKMAPDGKSGTVDATEVYDINEHYNDFDSQFSTRTFENVYNFKYNDTAKAYQLTERVSAVEK
ncbi:zinc ribbon domain-containing protein [Clostridium tyrobutyricum]|uniref:zinc ribbon domain-containing protein n=1 Tax=Clostridium tyrobutyricum TaxID=1519 RepID=UPI00164E551E|nr:DUF3185 family protein [Clostridium tyrobutyricum]